MSYHLAENALLRRGEAVTADNQTENAQRAAIWLAPAIQSNKVVLAHGNGPQLGTPAMLRSMEFDAATMRPKIKACCAFADATGKWAAIGTHSDIGRIVSA